MTNERNHIMTEKEMRELKMQLLRICVRLGEASKGWCVTYETPKQTREWIQKLHLEAESCAYKLGNIIDSLPSTIK
jgi:succinylglutamate desuccinylase